LSASKNTGGPTVSDNDIQGIALYTSVNTDSQNSFAPSTGTYQFNQTPNIPLTVSASLNFTATGTNQDYDIVFANIEWFNGKGDGGKFIKTSGTITAGTTQDILLNGILTLDNNPTEPDGFRIYYRKTNSGGTLKLNNVPYLRITQSITPNPATSSLTIFDPEFIDWDYNDYNVLLGNAERAQYSSYFMDVDYTSTYTTPVNFDLIISGTATPALVQDSNYNSRAWSDIRYNGSRYNSFFSNTQIRGRFNTTTTNTGDFNDPSTDGSGYGALPAAEQNKTFMAYFDAIGGTGPEIIDQTAYFVRYIIDEQGNVVNPEPDTTALYNLLGSFEVGKNALVRLISNDPTETTNLNDDTLTGLHPITHVGRISPILITETGSGNMDYVTTMSFNYLDGSPVAEAIANLTAKYQRSINTFISNTDWSSFGYQNTVYSNNWSNPINQDYRLDYVGGTIAAGTRVRLRVSFKVKKTSTNNNSFQFRILKNGDTSNVFFYSQVYNITSEDEPYKYETTNWFDANQNDYFTVQYRVGTGGTGFQLQIIGTGGGASDTTLTIEQETLPSTGFINGTTGTTASYWTVGEYTTGNNTTVLTGSQYLTNIYLSDQAIQSTPADSLSMGFSNITTPFFPIQVGDWIRFQYDENRLHCITKVDVGLQSNGTGSALFLTVVPPIATSSILNHFILYRIINDGTYVILNVNKVQSGNSFTGIIQPQYVSQTLKDKYNNIIQDLTQKGLIS
jgi:hypothetical protein